jgi:hypothetical protein
VIGALAVGLLALLWFGWWLVQRNTIEYDEDDYMNDPGGNWEPATTILARLTPLWRPLPATGAHRPERVVLGRHRIETREGIDMASCSKCGAEVIVVDLLDSEQKLVLDSVPNPTKGTVIMMGSVARYLDGPSDFAAVKKHHLPVYTRHGIYCGAPYPKHPSMR